MPYYIGLDVSQRQTSISIIDGEGGTVKEGKVSTAPSDIFAWITKEVDISAIVRAGHEAGAFEQLVACRV
jgi:hypothetical protein